MLDVPGFPLFLFGSRLGLGRLVTAILYFLHYSDTLHMCPCLKLPYMYTLHDSVDFQQESHLDNIN